MIEAEIAELSQQINEKRAQLERERGILPESKEAVKEVVAERLGAGERQVPAPPVATATVTQSSTGSYLDGLDDDSVHKVNALIEMLSKDGFKKTVEAAKNADPFIMDAFHDALVDRLHDDLKAQGLI